MENVEVNDIGAHGERNIGCEFSVVATLGERNG
jgi:hypothetical protein